MRRYIYTIILSATILTTISSCKKWLTLEPADGIVGTKFWKTKEQLASAVNGIYASLIDKSVMEYLFAWGELRADMIMPASGATSADIDVYNVNLLSTNATVNWRVVYRTINYCNTVIDLGPSVITVDKTLTREQLDQYLSEAYAIRALMYFYLVRSFGDVPLKLTATTSDDQLEQLAKSTQKDVLTQIVSDLNKAEANAVFTYNNIASDKGRITKNTVNAIQADVYLWMEKYPECVTACDKIINSGRVGLVTRGRWLQMFYEGNSNESIFEFQYNAGALNSFYGMFNTSKRRYMATDAVLEDIYTVDYANPDSTDYRADGASIISSNNTIVKYIWNATLDASYNHWIVYRYADILLMKAEAINQIGGRGQEALDIVNTIRRRGHALLATERNPGVDDQDDIADYILEERSREFAFEGKRWYDLLRNAKRDNYRRLDILLNMVVNAVPPERQQSALNKYKDYNSHYFPIYYYELQTDKNLEQNAFYK